eukprot:COSAG04_NODE_412_length_14743_cov_74.925294_2_plen_465_part_00
MTDPAPATTSGGAIPDLVKIRPITTDQTIDVQTSILEPIISNERFIKFQFDNKGILHSNSKIQLSLAGTAGERRFLPLLNGIGATIKRCVLSAGSKTIAEVDDWNHFHAYKSMFLSNESKKERETVLTGRVGAYEYDYSDTADTLASSQIKLDLDRDYIDDALWLPDTLDLDNDQTFQVNLSDLFPFLKQTQLPLYLMKDDITVELHLADARNRFWAPATDVDTVPKLANVRNEQLQFDHTKTKFIADYLIYPQDQMDNYQRQVETSGLTIPYFDYLLTRSTLTPAANKLTFTRTLGGANRICTKLILANTNAAKDVDSVDNVYNSQYKTVGDDVTVERLQVQIKYNDRNLFPRPIENSALMFNHLQACEGVPPFISKHEWDGTRAAGISAKTVEGYTTQSALADAPKNFLAFNLNRGERVNSRGVELEMTMPLADGATYTQRAWLEVAKVITLRGGRMTCTEA